MVVVLLDSGYHKVDMEKSLYPRDVLAFSKTVVKKFRRCQHKCVLTIFKSSARYLVTRTSSSTPFLEDRGNLASDKVVAGIGIAGKGRAFAKILTYLETRFAAPAESSFEESDSLTLVY
ncbi:hypothetical protein P3S68_019651 [Capsicum galapagoense]